MPNHKILYVTTEMSPYQEDSKMGQKVNQMALQMYSQVNDVRVFMPRFGLISERKFQLHEVIRLSGMNIIINDLDQPLLIKVASLPGERLQVYFIDNDEYFKRKAQYHDEDGKAFPDNDERAIFFARGVIETIKKLNWVPDVIHINGWMSALIPVYLKTYYKNDDYFKDTKIVLSLYNEGRLDMSKEFSEKLAFDNVGEDVLSEPKTASDVLKAAAPLVEKIIRSKGVTKAELKKLGLTDERVLEEPDAENMEELYGIN